MDPSGFGTRTFGLRHSLLEGSITPNQRISATSCSTAAFVFNGMGCQWTRATLPGGVVIACSSKWVCLGHRENTVGCSFRRASRSSCWSLDKASSNTGQSGSPGTSCPCQGKSPSCNSPGSWSRHSASLARALSSPGCETHGHKSLMCSCFCPLRPGWHYTLYNIGPRTFVTRKGPCQGSPEGLAIACRDTNTWSPGRRCHSLVPWSYRAFWVLCARARFP